VLPATGLLPLGLGQDQALAQSTSKHSLRLVYKPYAININFSSIPHHSDLKRSWTAFGSARLTAAELIECAVHDLGLPSKVTAAGQPVVVDYHLLTEVQGECKHPRGIAPCGLWH
jgi:hypothetical protein